MASSKVMASSSPSNPDLTRQPSPSLLNLQPDHTRGFGSMNMEEILRNLYTDPDSFPINGSGSGSGPEARVSAANAAAEPISGGGEGNESGDKSMEDAWRDIVSSGDGNGGEQRMTLENFLAKAGVGPEEEEIRVPAVVGMAPPVIMSAVPAVQFGGFGNGMVSGRGKRKAGVEEAPLDKATQQKQRRMIKNRESAARSRERKQAYTMELESLVTQLEKENAWLLKQQAEMNKERYKQLMETLIPVVEKQRPPRVLRRVHSMEW